MRKFMWKKAAAAAMTATILATSATVLQAAAPPDGETGAAMRYLSQRFAMPYRPVMGVLTDVGTEASTDEGICRRQAKHSLQREKLPYICDSIAVG